MTEATHGDGEAAPTATPAATPSAARAPVISVEDRLAQEAAFPWPERYPEPVGWMLSPELISQLGRVLGKPVDPRRWMRLRGGFAHVEDGAPISADTTEGPGRWRQVVRDAHTVPVRDQIVQPTTGELWFDYIADIGDGFAAMYSIGYLLQADLVTTDGAPLGSTALRPDGTPVALTVAAPAARDRVDPARLPRGQFLFVGGDAAYHVADRPTLAWRLQSPMYWAARDLDDAGLLDPTPHRLYGIPGNHDWYDHLDGFSRVFCEHATPVMLPDSPDDNQRRRWEAATPVRLHGFHTRQRGSYLAIQLPWDWQLWGLDIDQPLDALQQAYFDSQIHRDKLIVCVPSPPLVFHSGHDVPPPLIDAYRALELPPAYGNGCEINPLPPDSCRLDLSGDVHHYARYAGAWPEGRTDPSYHAVVSGLGGAFLHPSDTVHSDRPPVEGAVFPPPDAARAEVSRGANWWVLFGGGWMRGIPLVLGALCASSWIQPGASQRLARWWLHWLGICEQDDGWLPMGRHGDWGAWGIAPEYLSAAKAVLSIGGVVLLAVGGWMYLRVARRRRADLSLGAPSQSAFRLSWLVPSRSYAPAWAVLLLGITALVVGRWLAPGAVSAVLLDAFVIALVTAAPVVAGVAIAWNRARKVSGAAFFYLAVVATGHVAVQLLTLLVLVLLGFVAPITTLAVAVGYLALSYVVPSALLRRGWGGGIAAVWLVILVGALAAIVAASDGHWVAVVPTECAMALGLVQRLAVVAASSVLAMFVGSAHVGWYLAAAARFHNNELGGAARVDRFRQFIRFRVTPTQVTGFVIALDRVVDWFPRDEQGRATAAPPAATAGPGPARPAGLRPFLIDVFTLAPRPAATDD